MQNILDSELERLGIDPEREPAKAPSRDRNAVFDLVVSYRSTRSGATLHWTERMVGDYDMNGEVNVSDLTPISQRWKYTVDHLPPQEANGFLCWPAGHPLNGGFSGVLQGYPGWNTPADQWRTARVDGDDNGEINAGDITPIAQQWHERLDSYRVYRRAPGEDEFSMLRLGEEDTSSIPRSIRFKPGATAPDNAWPYRLHYADVTIQPGLYEYYLAPYDSVNDDEGTPSPVVTINFDDSSPPPQPEGNEPPVISVVADVTTGDAPLRVEFDASGSTDPDGEIVLYVWDWEGDGQVDATSQSSPYAYHIYHDTGWFRPTLTVWDDRGGSDTATIDIEVGVGSGGVLPPKVELYSYRKEGPRPYDAYIHATVVDNSGTELQYSWDFDGDGAEDSNEAPADYGNHHKYPDVGEFTVRLTVTNGLGLSSFGELVVTVTDNADPVAELLADETAGEPGLLVHFDASGSFDPEGGELYYTWDLDGDGDFNLGTGPVAQYAFRYEEQGTYNAAVKASDPEGAFGIASVQINVVEPPNVLPVAVITAEYDSFPAEYELQVNANDSYDPDGWITRSEWDLDNDGVFERRSSYAYLNYPEPGTYTVSLMVTDNSGATDVTTRSFEIFLNNPPLAELTADPLQGVVPLPVHYDATGSSDPDGDEISFGWNYDYDDVWKNFTPGESESDHTFTKVGKYRCRVRVSDPWGWTDEAEVLIDCSMLPDPGEWYIVFVDDGYADVWSPGLDMELVDGRPAIAYSAGPTAWAGLGEERYVRAADADGIAWDEPLALETPVWPSDGAMGASLEIVNGAPAVSWGRHTGHVLYCPAQDAQGGSWSTPVLVEHIGGTGGGVELCSYNGKPALAWANALNQLKFARSADSGGLSWPVIQLIQGYGGGFNFQPGLEDVNGELCMAYAANGKVLYRKALDSEASAWSDPVEIWQATGSSPSVAFHVINGIPMVVYYCELGLVYQIAPGGLGSIWLEPVVITTEGSSSNNWTAAEFCLSELDGRPAVLDQSMGLWIANNATGSEWTGPEHLPAGYSGRAFDLLEVNGNPAIAFQDRDLYYAVKLP